MMTSGISGSTDAQSFGDAHKDNICLHVIIEVSVCCERLRCTV
jgi:hypothetical protein